MDTRNYMKEFTGSSILVISHSNELYKDMKGSIVEETARTFKISVNGHIKIVPKKTGRFTINSEKFSLTIKGSSILMRPEERLKNLRKIIKHENKGDDYN